MTVWIKQILARAINLFFYNNKKPKLICKRTKEMQESMEDAIAAELEFYIAVIRRITGS